MTNSQQYQTLPTAILNVAEQGDRWLQGSELKAFSDFFRSGEKRLAVVKVLAEQSDEIVAAAGDRIFYGGSAMAYLERPANRVHLPGYTPFPKRSDARSKERLKLEVPKTGDALRRAREFLRTQFSQDRDPVPDGFRRINIRRYGEVRMKRSMRDLSWFLRYVTYAIAAGDCSILTANVEGLRGVIPEDVTEATIVALCEMRWRSLRFFPNDAEAIALIKEAFGATIEAYRVEKPSLRLRSGFADGQQGLQLPESYAISADPRPRFVMKPHLAETEQQAVIKAAYRQVFERDITREYGIALTAIESRFRSGEYSTKEFIRQLGHSRRYRDLFYEPFTIARSIELAVRHFLGRAISSREEFQNYFAVISEGGLAKLVDAIVDSPEYTDYFGEETVPYPRRLGQEAQECRNWSAQQQQISAIVQKVPQFLRLSEAQKPLPNQHYYGANHDPIEPFSAVFPVDRTMEHSAPFNSENRRILIHQEAAIAPLRLSVHRSPHANVDLLPRSPETVVQAVYRQVLGRDVLSDQRLPAAEVKVKSGEITVRDFVRSVAKTPLFRSLHWDNLYVTKAIESIHRRLIGRPTIGREEMSRYYDIAARQGFYALVDALIDSREYTEAFSEDTVPHERYHTPHTHEGRSRLHPFVSKCPAEGDRVADRTWMRQAMERWKAQLNGHSTEAPASELPQPLQSMISQISEETAGESADVAPPSGEMQGSRETADAV